MQAPVVRRADGRPGGSAVGLHPDGGQAEAGAPGPRGQTASALSAESRDAATGLAGGIITAARFHAEYPVMPRAARGTTGRRSGGATGLGRVRRVRADIAPRASHDPRCPVRLRASLPRVEKGGRGLPSRALPRAKRRSAGTRLSPPGQRGDADGRRQGQGQGQSGVAQGLDGSPACLGASAWAADQTGTPPPTPIAGWDGPSSPGRGPRVRRSLDCAGLAYALHPRRRRSIVCPPHAMPKKRRTRRSSWRGAPRHRSVAMSVSRGEPTPGYHQVVSRDDERDGGEGPTVAESQLIKCEVGCRFDLSVGPVIMA